MMMMMMVMMKKMVVGCSCFVHIVDSLLSLCMHTTYSFFLLPLCDEVFSTSLDNFISAVHNQNVYGNKSCQEIRFLIIVFTSNFHSRHFGHLEEIIVYCIYR